jgi:hypothetical protein
MPGALEEDLKVIEPFGAEVFKSEDDRLRRGCALGEGMGGDVGILPRGEHRIDPFAESRDFRLMGGGCVDLHGAVSGREEAEGEAEGCQ